jgi:hypothetical protein
MTRATLNRTSAEAPFAPLVWRSSRGGRIGAVTDDLVGGLPEPSRVCARIDLRAHDEVGLWCSLPAALSSRSIKRRPPRLHLHVRPKSGGRKVLDTDIDALFINTNSIADVDARIGDIIITPTIAFNFARAYRSSHPFELRACSHCAYVCIAVSGCGDPNQRCFCSNCGSDQTIATILPVFRWPDGTQAFTTPSRDLDLDRLDDCTYTIWASTPALIWTAQRPQEAGIHVHVDRGVERIVDDTFASVRLNSKLLDRAALLDAMMEHSEV